MAGVKQFDEDRVLDTVMRTFWTNGYADTSMADLADATGVIRGSLYHAYGGKDALLMAALDRYMDAYGTATRHALDNDNPFQAISDFFDVHLARMRDAATPTGCLVCHTAAECGGDNSEIGARVAAYFKSSEDALTKTLRRGIANGFLREDTDVRAVARFYLGISRGMAVVHKAYGTSKPVKDMADVAIKSLSIYATGRAKG